MEVTTIKDKIIENNLQELNTNIKMKIVSIAYLDIKESM